MLHQARSASRILLLVACATLAENFQGNTTPVRTRSLIYTTIDNDHQLEVTVVH